MPRVQGFPPIAGRNATTLILGSMPGVASLRAGRYYAHPQNLFWRIVGEVLEGDATATYAAGLRMLADARIALWDVVGSCSRKGSLDADIDDASVVPNDFRAFFQRHPRVTRVFFNGAKAEASFRRHVLPLVAARQMTYRRLPSTSPANASQTYAKKLLAWREIRYIAMSRDLRGARAAARS